jgi:hypothetical protein
VRIVSLNRSFEAVVVAALSFAIAGCTGAQPSGARSASPSTSTPSAPSATPTATPIPTPTPSFEVIGERLAPGTHTARPFDPALPEPWGVCAGQSGCAETTADDTIGITYTVPEGWAFGFRAAVTKPSAGTVAPSGMSLHFLRGGWLFSDPCVKVDGPPDIEVGPRADDFADALAAHPLLDATTPVDVTLGGFSGKYLDLQLPSDISGCTYSYLPWAPAFYAQGPNHRWHVWSLDVEGVRVVIQNGDFAGTLPADLAEMHAIIDSIKIEP